MRVCCQPNPYGDSPIYTRTGSRFEFPLLVERRRDDGTHGYAGMVRDKPVELAAISDEAWSELRTKINSEIFKCPFSYGRTGLFMIFWFMFVATAVITTFSAIGPSAYFWEAFWECQSDHNLYHEPYTYEFCSQYSGWDAACMLSFFFIFSVGFCGYAYRESRMLKRWAREVEPVLVLLCKEHSPLFERYGYFVEMKNWTVVFRRMYDPTQMEQAPPTEVFGIQHVETV